MRTNVLPDKNGNTLAMHFNETGVTLKGGNHDGRLLRPARWYAQGDFDDQMARHYTSAVYSDDGGVTWYASEPFPAMGTGEAALVQLSDGSVYYNTRRHWTPLDRTEPEDGVNRDGVNRDGVTPLDRTEPEDALAEKAQRYASGRTRRRWSALSTNGGAAWSDARLVGDLPDGPQGDDFGLFGGLARLDPDALPDRRAGCDDLLLFSNVEHLCERRNGVVWLSTDSGARWLRKRVLDGGEFGYSSLAAGRAGTPSEGWVYCFFEAGRATRYFEVGSVGRLARFNMAWLVQGTDLSAHRAEDEENGLEDGPSPSAQSLFCRCC